jgi:O-antigen ligase
MKLMSTRFLPVVLLGSLLCGLAAVAGTELIDTRALVVLPGLLAVATIAGGVLARKDPLPTVGAAALVLMPIAGHFIPPARWMISVFDVLGLLAAVSLLVSRNGATGADRLRRPPPWVWLPLAALVPALLVSIDPIHSIATCIEIGIAYCLLVAILRVGRQPEDALRLITRWIAIATIVASAAVVFDHFTLINLAMTGGYNLNAFAEAGIYRAGGLFQDPQKAAQFLGSFMTYLVVLASRKTVPQGVSRALLLAAVASAFVGLMFTVSRSGLLAGVGFSFIGFLFSNRFSAALRTMLIALILLAGWMAASAPAFIQSALPATLAHRLANLGQGADSRVDIWIDSWHLFVEHPVAGLGPGNYREALMRERPSLRGLHELGEYVPDQPENGYLKILFETGAIGAAGVLAFAVALCRNGIARAASEEAQSYKLAALFAMLAFSFSFATLFTVSDHRNLMIVVVMIAIMHLAGLRPQPPGGKQ